MGSTETDGQVNAAEPLSDSPMLIRVPEANGFVRTNASFRSQAGYSDKEIATQSFIDWIEPSGHEALRAALARRDGHCQVAHRTSDGGLLDLDVSVAMHGDGAMVLATRSETHAASRSFGHTDDEVSVLGTLDTIARIVEEQNPGYRCSILLVADGRFVSGAGPSLPKEYNEAIDGSAVGPAVGSCGTAIFWKVPVIAVDIQADPLWAMFADLAKKAGVASCWSHPFASSSGNVLGALALYGSTPGAPTPEQLGRLRAAARMTGLAVERGRAEDALKKQRERELVLEEQLRQAAKMEALGVLAGGVAHDFNNVLATIMAHTELAIRVLPPGSPAAPMLAEVIAASRRAGQFCQQMLAYAGRGSLKSARIEIGTLLSELRGLVQAALSKKASLTYSLHPAPIHVEGDENQLLQVVMNLITNAAEALGEEAGEIVVRSSVAHYDVDALRRLDPQAALVAGDYVRVEVQDTGCGMSADTIARIFDPFFTTKFAGRGLGLSAAKGIVAKHRGAIEIQSAVGGGTTITVVLPCLPHADPAEAVERKTAPSVTQKRILVVDDEAPLRKALALQLRHNGFDVVEASDGQQAIDIFLADPFAIDGVLLDLNMPKLSGHQVHERMARVRPGLPVVLMSGYSEEEVLSRFAGIALAGNLQKPFEAATLLETLNGALA
jgi:signal transduction histidine kinase/CheY-like chemotaxis protein